MKSKFLNYTSVLFFLLVFLSSNLYAQELTQTFRGTITDKDSEMSLIGATVFILGSDPAIGTTTDLDGYFKLENVPVGRMDVEVTYLGYETIVLSNLMLTSGKELVMNLTMLESSVAMETVVVTARQDKKKALNDLATLSSRAFSVEETSRYAAGQFDPARMAQNYAGVGVGNGTGLSNEIIVRGNSPKGILWRLEGVEIPNPNHFGAVGGSGGSISMLSSTILNNSDFYTGAFPSEYGNAVSGVFDLKMRNGNNEKREYAFMLGLLGIEAGLEGPFRQGGKASYLVNYRYSTLDVLSQLGIDIAGDVAPKYQDLSFKMNFPTKKAGVFSIFGLGGMNKAIEAPLADSTAWISPDENEGFLQKQQVGTIGATHKYLLSDKSYLHSALVVSSNNAMAEDYYLEADDQYNNRTMGTEEVQDNALRLSSTYNQKINARNTLRTGVILSHLSFRYKAKQLGDSDLLETQFDNAGQTQLAQAFAHWKHRLGDWTINTGVHYTHLFFNNSYSIEPRLAASWKLSDRHSFSAAAGIHSKVENLGLYLFDGILEDGEVRKPAKNLKLPKAFHAVFAYDFYLNETIRLKAETYYQRLYHIPISNQAGSNDSAINADDISNLIDLIDPVSQGTGYNYGLDLTIEKFFSQQYYFLVTGSLYNSKFVPKDGKTYNTDYNGNYQLNALAGKEWTVGKSKNALLGVNAKFVLAGGKRITPINLEASQAQGEAVGYADRLYEDQTPSYYRFDLGFSYKINRPNLTHSILIDFQNVTNRLNIFAYGFDDQINGITPVYQIGFIPNLNYRIEF